MDEAVKRIISDRFPEEAHFDHPMARITSFRVGGPADCLLYVRGMEDLRAAVDLARAHDLPVTLLGAGSNLLVRDGGIPGLAISFAKGFRGQGLRREGERDAVLWAEAGVKINSFLAYAQRGGWAGTEFLAGTPGTMGGAAAMNAGVRDREMKDIVLALTFMTPDGKQRTVARDALVFRYRGLDLTAGAIICTMDLAVSRDDPAEIKERMTALLSRRKRSQPLSIPNAGSIFKNPPGDYAARLIEQSGLKGVRTGGAAISELHANFIVNLDGARAEDILRLIDRARAGVQASAGVELETEVRVLGVDAPREGAA